MKERYFTAAVPAVLAAMGVILSWTNLRFPGTVPTGMNLFFLFPAGELTSLIAVKYFWRSK